MDHIERARHYRDEARVLREIANRDSDATTRERLLEIALSYERLYEKHTLMARQQNLGPAAQK